ncbi:LADA_0F09450g1_1 [Lachancea dasiensis]|uniref:Kinetochore-associated protein n=1 Tax=Lachancea dasiensis TaxID=1072105 RepID=A0A1G4JLX5_9SACH|nr:LADA_0F09450g1_1 [Lachancea dasiensis]
MTEGVRIRYTRLNQVCRKALQQAVNKVQNWDKLASCFPEYSRLEPGAKNISTCQKQVVDFWMELSKREFEEIFSERDIENKLNDLDDLISDAKATHSTFKPGHDSMACIDKLSPKQLISGNIHDSRLKLLDQLDDRLSKVTDVNNTLEDELRQLQETLQLEVTQLDDMYDRCLGQETNSYDEVLEQGWRDMLLELREG